MLQLSGRRDAGQRKVLFLRSIALFGVLLVINDFPDWMAGTPYLLNQGLP